MSSSAAIANGVNGSTTGDAETALEISWLGDTESGNVGFEIEAASVSEISHPDDCSTQSSRADKSVDTMRAPTTDTKLDTPSDPLTHLEQNEEPSSTSGAHRPTAAPESNTKASKLCDANLPKFSKITQEAPAETPSGSTRDRLRESLPNANSLLKSICETSRLYGKNYADHVHEGFKVALASSIVISKVLQIPIDISFRISEVVLATGIVAGGAVVSAIAGVITCASMGNVAIFSSDPLTTACKIAQPLVKDAMPISNSTAGVAANKVAMLVGLPVTMVVGGTIALVASLGTAGYATAMYTANDC